MRSDKELPHDHANWNRDSEWTMRCDKEPGSAARNGPRAGNERLDGIIDKAPRFRGLLAVGLDGVR